jgi:DNA-binding response OmpR family regulator
MKILVVDDDPHILDALSVGLALQWPECEVLAARDGEEGLELFFEREPDVVVLDVNMPRKNGFEVLQELGARGRIPALRVIVVTTEGRDEDARRGLAAGAAAYLTKPFRAEEVRAAIAALPEPE